MRSLDFDQPSREFSLMPDFKGRCIGVRLSRRDDDSGDKHVMVTLLIEDDEFWHEQDFSVSSAWLDETIDMLTMAR